MRAERIAECCDQGLLEDDEDEGDAKAADVGDLAGQDNPDRLQAELQRRKMEAQQ